MNLQNYVKRTHFRLRQAVPNVNSKIDFNGEIVIDDSKRYCKILDFVVKHNKRSTRAYYLYVVSYVKSDKLKIVHSFFKPRNVVIFNYF